MKKRNIFFLLASIIVIGAILYSMPIVVNGPTYISDSGWSTIATNPKAVTKTVRISSSENNAPFYVVVKDYTGVFLTDPILVNPGEDVLVMNNFNISNKNLIIQAKTLKSEGVIDFNVKMGIFL